MTDDVEVPAAGGTCGPACACPRGLLALAGIGFLLGAEPLLYVGAWRAFPGWWIAHFPQPAGMVLCLVAAGVLTAITTAALAVRACILSEESREGPGFFAVVLIAGAATGAGLGWCAYMAIWRA